MVREYLRSLGVVSVICLAAGCSREPVPAGEAAPAAAAAPKRELPASLEDPAGMLKVSPGAVDGCAVANGGVALDVSWNATGRTEGVQIFWVSPGEAPKLWLAAGAVGQDKSGPWAVKGTKIQLVNGADSAALAEVVLDEVPCQ